MKFANVNGERVEPAKKLRGECPFCGSEVVAKCGNVRIHHWAHKSNKHCDHWWETEKEWHRNWKNLFPSDWQEIGRRDENGELHKADVLTPHGLALEFQHSAIPREEVEIRTRFHKNICWVVDGLRLKTTLKQFKTALEDGHRLKSGNIPVHKVYFWDFKFIEKWSHLGAPVVLDFGGDDLWTVANCYEDFALMYALPRSMIVENFKAGNRPPPVEVQQPKTQRVRYVSRPRRGRRRIRRF